MIWYQLRSGAEPGGLRGQLPPLLEKKILEVGILWTILWYFTLTKKKTSHLAFNTKKVGKKIFSHIPNHITFSPNILFLLVLSHHICLHPFYCSFFSKEIVFSLIFTTLFLWNNDMNTINFTNWRFINHKKKIKKKFKHLCIIFF